MEGTELEQLRVFIARQQAQLDQLQQQVQQQQVHQAQARQESPVGQDLSELEKIPIFDGNEAHFAECGGSPSRQRADSQVWKRCWDSRSCRPTTKQASTFSLNSLRSPWRTRLCTISWLRRAEAERRGLPKHAGLVAWRQMVRLCEPQVGRRLHAMLVGVLSPVWRQGDSYQFEEDLTALDTRITEYERDSGKMVDPEVRMAVITQHVPQSLRQVV